MGLLRHTGAAFRTAVPEPGAPAGGGGPGDRNSRPVVALVPWGLTLEDFLIPNRLSLEDFCTDFTGSWMFGYVLALRAAGVETVIFCVSSGVREVTRRVHRATGSEICLIPTPPAYRLLTTGMRFPYARTVRETFRAPWPLQLPLYPLLFAAKEAAPFLATPARTLARELRRYGCDALLHQEYEFPRFDVCALLGRLQRIPVFATFQGGDYQRWWVERVTRPFAIRFATGLIVGSEAERERIRARYAAPNVAAIPNPVDVDTWRPHDRALARRSLRISDTTRVAAWHGRVDLWKKGLDTLIDAWARVTARGGDTKLLLLIGTGEDASEVRRRLTEGRLENVLWIDRYVHGQDDLARLLSAADVYAFTSRHEGFPVAPVEAMACGLPIVSTDVSGIRDVLAAGERSGGVIVPREDPQRFAQELGRLLENVSLSRELGALARAQAEAFAAPSIGRKLRSFLLPSAPDPAPDGASPGLPRRSRKVR